MVGAAPFFSAAARGGRGGPGCARGRLPTLTHAARTRPPPAIGATRAAAASIEGASNRARACGCASARRTARRRERSIGRRGGAEGQHACGRPPTPPRPACGGDRRSACSADDRATGELGRTKTPPPCRPHAAHESRRGAAPGGSRTPRPPSCPPCRAPLPPQSEGLECHSDGGGGGGNSRGRGGGEAAVCSGGCPSDQALPVRSPRPHAPARRAPAPPPLAHNTHW